MKKVLSCILWVTLVFRVSAQTGFNSVNNLAPIPILTNTSETQQAKVWAYANKFWTVLGTSSGTIIYRLDGTTWTNVLVLASGSTAKPDIRVVNNLVHVLVYKGSTMILYSLEYDIPTAKYKLWTKRPARVEFTLESGAQTSTVDIDTQGRMWIASDGTTDMNIRWSDDPYSTWSAPIKLETSASTTDLCAVVAMPALGKMGFFWSNKITKRFGFKTHVDGTDPTIWSADESPASQSALNIGAGFADNQFNVKSNSDGTVYAAIKTGYNTAGSPQLGLLVRQTSGNWDPMYPVTLTNAGTRPIILLNNFFNRLKVVYTSNTGSIVYNETPIPSIGFGAPINLISGSNDYSTSVKSTYTGEIVVLATNATNAVGILGVDAAIDNTPPEVQSINRQSPSTQNTSVSSVVYRITFSEQVSGVDITDFQLTQVTGNVTGSISSVAAVGGNNAIYNVTVDQLNGFGDIRLDLKNSGTNIKDGGGNDAPGFQTGQIYTIVPVPPSLTIVTISSNNSLSGLAKSGDIITISMTASTSISTPSVTIASRVATVSNTGGDNYDAVYTMTNQENEGTIPFTIDFTSTGGTAGLQVTSTTNSSSVVFDKTVPGINSISRQLPTTQNTTASSVVYRVTFSEQVTGVNSTDFQLTQVTGNVTGSISSVAAVGGNGTTYDVTIDQINGLGDIRLDLKNSGTNITDGAGNLATGFQTGQLYSIVEVAPTLTVVTISSNNASSGLAKAGDIITMSMTASKAISTPSVSIASGVATVSNTGGNSYNAVYTMTIQDNEGTIPFTIDYASIGGTPGLQVTSTTNSSSVFYDKTVPVVNSISRQIPLIQTTSSNIVTWRVIFSEGVSGVDLNDFQVTRVSGTVNGTLSTITPVGSSGTTFDVAVNNITGDGNIRLDLNSSGTAIIDLTGNFTNAGFNQGQIYSIQQVIGQSGFVSVVQASSLAMKSPTKDKPQSKVWKYADKWWAVISVTGGTKIFRLDNLTWTPVLTLANTDSRCDARLVGNVVHILLYKGAKNNSYLYSVEYDPVNTTYKLWNGRPGNANKVTFTFPAGSETATMALDGNGRMWFTSAGTTAVYTWWSDSPYNNWSAPITIASGIKDDDISALVPIPTQGKIGLFWSNQTTKKFGFRTHVDGTSPTQWTADEVPASASGQNVGDGFSDDHMNLKVSNDGTVYVASKTGYNTNGFAKLILLIRRPNGTWDNAYTVTNNPEGTQPTVILNEATGKLKIIYASLENGGNILYKESNMSPISFSPVITLFQTPGELYDYVTTTHQNYSEEIVLMFTNMNTLEGITLVASDVASGQLAARVRNSITDKDAVNITSSALIYPNPFTTQAVINFNLQSEDDYTVSLYNTAGSVISILKKGRSIPGQMNQAFLDGNKLSAGLYYVVIQTNKGAQTLKVIRR